MIIKNISFLPQLLIDLYINRNENLEGRKEMFLFNDALNTLFTVIWTTQRERKLAAATWVILFDYQQGLFYMHHPTDRIIHTTAFVTPVMEHRLNEK